MVRPRHETADLIFIIEHVGLDVDFHHPQGRSLKLADCIVEAFEQHREHAEIFVQHSSGLSFSCDEILRWFLLQTGTTLADHLPPHTLNNFAGQVMLTVPIRFVPGMFFMTTEAGEVDLSALNLLCKVTIKTLNG